MNPKMKRPAFLHLASAVLACAVLTAALPSARPAAAAPPAKQAMTAPQAPQATPIVGGTSYGSAVPISPGVDYSGVLTDTHLKDFFYFDVNPGAIVTLTFTSGVTWTSQARFYLDDQAHVSALDFKNIVGAEQTDQITYMGKSTTPTRYFFRPESVNNTGITNYYGFKLALENQFDGGQAFDAGEVATSARLITPTLGGSVTYTGTLGNADTDDWYRIAAVPGQIISISVAVTDYGPNPYPTRSYLYDAANASSDLERNLHNDPDVAPKSLSYISNSSAPAAYLFRVLRDAASLNGTSRYTFTIFSSQQADGNTPGDAGEDFDSARLISPTLDANTNLLGRGDKKDFYKIDLPIDPTSGLNVGAHFKFFVKPIAWPAGSSGSLIVTKYDASRAQVGSVQSITAPVVKALEVDLTDCDLCYISVEDQTSGTKQFAYSFSLVKPLQVFIPLVRR